MSNQKTTGKTVQTRAAHAAIANRLDTEAIANEVETWDFIQKFFPDAITAIAEYAYSKTLSVFLERICLRGLTDTC